MSRVSPLSLKQRDQYLVIASLAVLVIAAWVYLIVLDTSISRIQPAIHVWTPVDFIAMFLMWAVMMIGMMVPSAMRTVLIYSRIVMNAQSRSQAIAPTHLFVSGYIVIWSLFSLLATTMQWLLEMAALLSPMMTTTSSYLGAALLICAGVYQLTPLKDACLKHCQSPAAFIASHYRKGSYGAFQLGMQHGIYCLGCCWALMGLIFLGGVMNLMWILAISLFVLAEKLLPPRIRSVRITGMTMILSGLLYLLA